MTGNVVIELEGVNKWFGDFHVLKDINLKIRERERVVVCGPSGSGKSTVIRCINRLEEHQEGRIVVDGQELDDDTKNVAAVRREVGMVFQQFNLFPTPHRDGQHARLARPCGCGRSRRPRREETGDGRCWIVSGIPGAG